jgi:hypothetical protein
MFILKIAGATSAWNILYLMLKGKRMTTEEKHISNMLKRIDEVSPKTDVTITYEVQLMKLQNGTFKEKRKYTLASNYMMCYQVFGTRQALRAFCDKNIEGFYSKNRRY